MFILDAATIFTTTTTTTTTNTNTNTTTISTTITCPFLAVFTKTRLTDKMHYFAS